MLNHKKALRIHKKVYEKNDSLRRTNHQFRSIAKPTFS